MPAKKTTTAKATTVKASPAKASPAKVPSPRKTTSKPVLPAKPATNPVKASAVSAGRATPRRILTVADDQWRPFQELAAGRGIGASELLRQMIVIAVHEARQSGELPTPVRNNGKAA